MNSHGFLAILNKSDFDRKLKAKGAGVKRSEKERKGNGFIFVFCERWSRLFIGLGNHNGTR